jgi:hypothetical protein
MTTTLPLCVACGRGIEEVPLITLRYKAIENWICPQHLPLLIHQPERLVGKMAGAEHLAPADVHDHPHD